MIYSPAYTPLSAVGGGASAWRRWALAPVLARYAALLGDGFGDGAHCTAGIAASALSTGLCRRYFGGGRHIGYSHSASVVLVIYAIIVEASIIKIFQAAIVPGVLAVLFFFAVIAVVVRIFPAVAGQMPPPSAAEKKRAIRRATPVLLIFGIVIFGLSMGVFTPTPAAGIGVAAVLLYGLIAKRLTVDGLISSLLDTAKTAAMIAFVLFGAEVLKGFFSRSGLPIALSEWAMVADISPLTVLLLVLLAFVVLGCFMDSFSMILVVTPFFWPVLAAINGGEWVSADAAAFGMDIDGLKIWFGVLCLIVVELGLITPPVGLNVFVISALTGAFRCAIYFAAYHPFWRLNWCALL